MIVRNTDLEKENVLIFFGDSTVPEVGEVMLASFIVDNFDFTITKSDAWYIWCFGSICYTNNGMQVAGGKVRWDSMHLEPSTTQNVSFHVFISFRLTPLGFLGRELSCQFHWNAGTCLWIPS